MTLQLINLYAPAERVLGEGECALQFWVDLSAMCLDSLMHSPSFPRDGTGVVVGFGEREDDGVRCARMLMQAAVPAGTRPVCTDALKIQKV